MPEDSLTPISCPGIESPQDKGKKRRRVARSRRSAADLVRKLISDDICDPFDRAPNTHLIARNCGLSRYDVVDAALWDARRRLAELERLAARRAA